MFHSLLLRHVADCRNSTPPPAARRFFPRRPVPETAYVMRRGLPTNAPRKGERPIDVGIGTKMDPSAGIVFGYAVCPADFAAVHRSGVGRAPRRHRPVPSRSSQFLRLDRSNSLTANYCVSI